jgi:ArsR family transcriptional regulator
MYEMVKALKSLSDSVRLRMINLLMQRECCVCEVMQILQISQTRASRNLNMLYDAGFLKLRKDGLWSHYSVDKERMKPYLSILIDAIDSGLKNDKILKTDRKKLEELTQVDSVCAC